MGNPWAPVIDTGLEFGCFFARHVSAKSSVKNPESMGDLQDPIDGGTLVPYVWSYFVVIFTCIGLKNRPYIYGRYLHFRILKFPLTESVTHFREKLLETLHFQAPQLPWVVLPSHWSTVKKHGNWTNDFVKEYDWQIWTEFDQWEGWCRDRWFIINLSYFSVFIQNIHQFCQEKMRRSSFWTRGFAALKRCSPIFWTNLYDWDHWTSHAMCTCIGVIHWYMYMKKNMKWYEWIYTFVMQPNYKHAQGIKKIHDMLCLIPSASRKKMLAIGWYPHTPRSPVGSRPGWEQKWMGHIFESWTYQILMRKYHQDGM